MNIAKHMEAVFIAAIAIVAATGIATAAVPAVKSSATAAVPVSGAMQTVMIVGKRLPRS